MTLFYFHRSFAVVVPLPGGIHRVLTIEPKPAIPEREPTLDEMQAKLRTVAEDDSLVLSAPEWFSYTDLSMGLAPALRDGRILLAGDVGNPVLPDAGSAPVSLVFPGNRVANRRARALAGAICAAVGRHHDLRLAHDRAAPAVGGG